MANIDLGNLTRYDGKIKQYAEDKYLSKNTANWQMTEKAGAVTCYPVPDTELELIVDFSFKEVPPVSGDKSPSNPSTIEGVNNLSVSCTGKNIYTMGNALNNTFNGVTISYDNDIITLNGTCDLAESQYKEIYYYYNTCTSKSNGFVVGHIEHLGGSYSVANNYTDTPITVQVLNKTKDTSAMGYWWLSDTGIDSTSVRAWSLVNPRYFYICSFRIKGQVTYNNYKIKVQFEFIDNNQYTFFEPYQSNSYIYQLGNTYYGGSVNLATGLMTVTHNIFKVGDYSNTVEFNTEYNCWRVYITPKADYTVLPICTHSTFKQGSDFLNAIDSTFRWAAGGLGQWFMFKSPVTTAEEFLAIYENAYIVFKLLNPYTIQLDPVQIKSLTALDKNTPRLNTLYTDADSIQIGYQKHPARTAYELENAILALGGGE